MGDARDELERQKAADAADGKRAEAAGVGIRITYDGKTYTAYAGDITALDALELRRQTGMSWPQLVRELADGYDIDLCGVVIWLVRRLAGERDLRLDAVLAAIRMDDDMTIGTVPRSPTPGPLIADAATGEVEETPEA